jgi:hypothetical protein
MSGRMQAEAVRNFSTQKCRLWKKQLPYIKASLHKGDFVKQNEVNYTPTHTSQGQLLLETKEKDTNEMKNDSKKMCEKKNVREKLLHFP